MDKIVKWSWLSHEFTRLAFPETEPWGAKDTLYCYRSMIKDEDALNALTGVLQQLETMHDTGFFWGLPQVDFQWSLLWQAQTQPQRGLGFPSWSWAGWGCP